MSDVRNEVNDYIRYVRYQRKVTDVYSILIKLFIGKSVYVLNQFIQTSYYIRNCQDFILLMFGLERAEK